MSLSSAFHMTSVCQIPQVAQTFYLLKIYHADTDWTAMVVTLSSV